MEEADRVAESLMDSAMRVERRDTVSQNVLTTREMEVAIRTKRKREGMTVIGAQLLPHRIQSRPLCKSLATLTNGVPSATCGCITMLLDTTLGQNAVQNDKRREQQVLPQHGWLR